MRKETNAVVMDSAFSHKFIWNLRNQHTNEKAFFFLNQATHLGFREWRPWPRARASTLCVDPRLKWFEMREWECACVVCCYVRARGEEGICWSLCNAKGEWGSLWWRRIRFSSLLFSLEAVKLANTESDDGGRVYRYDGRGMWTEGEMSGDEERMRERWMEERKWTIPSRRRVLSNFFSLVCFLFFLPVRCMARERAEWIGVERRGGVRGGGALN